MGENGWIWEINASLKSYGDRTRNGLVRIYLPQHSRKHFRLTDNIHSGYAVLLKWKDIKNETMFVKAVHMAWNRRRRDYSIDNSRELRKRNAPIKGKFKDCKLSKLLHE